MLTDKTKEHFEKWYLGKYKYEFSLKYMEVCNGGKYIFDPRIMLLVFECSPFSMQIGVYEDFFDSVGMKTSIEFDGYSYYFDIFLNINETWHTSLGVHGMKENYTTRTEARIAAIEKANSIYNESNN
jgi:hypothetical protein